MRDTLPTYEIREALTAAGYGGKEAIYAEYGERYRCSKATIQRALREAFGKQFTIQRPQRVPQAVVDAVAEMKVEGLLLSEGAGVQREKSTDACIRTLIDMGKPGVVDYQTGEVLVSPSTVNRRLREIGFRQRKIQQRIEPEHVNQEWQIDFSRSKYFQLFDYDKLKVHAKELHYKSPTGKQRLWVVQVKESCSRVRLVRGYAATGESWQIGLAMLRHLFIGDHDMPLRYLPDRLKGDNGAFMKKKEVLEALRALDIEAHTSTPGYSDSQGKVESGFRGYWSMFELDIAQRLGQGAIITVDEYNELAEEFCLREAQTKKHPLFFKETRAAVYFTGVQTRPQRTTDMDIVDLALATETRKVDQTLLFSWKGLQYQAPAWAAGKRVRVHQNLNGDVQVESLDEYRKLAMAIPPKSENEKYPYRYLDDFEHRPHATPREQLETRIKAKMSDEKQQRAAAYKEGKRHFMPPRETTVTPDSPFAEQAQQEENFASYAEARAWIGQRISSLTGEDYDTYQDFFDDLLCRTLNREEIRTEINVLWNMVQDQLRQMTLAN